MSDKYRTWMPIWLATYIFLVGLVVLETAKYAFCMWACEADLLYIWQYGAALATVAALPWVWYFTYLAYRYIDEIPRLGYIFIAAPFISYIHSVLSRETFYSDIFTFNDVTYIICIGWGEVLLITLIIYGLYDIYIHQSKYIEFLYRVKEVGDAS